MILISYEAILSFVLCIGTGSFVFEVCISNIGHDFFGSYSIIIYVDAGERLLCPHVVPQLSRVPYASLGAGIFSDKMLHPPTPHEEVHSAQLCHRGGQHRVEGRAVLVHPQFTLPSQNSSRNGGHGSWNPQKLQ